MLRDYERAYGLHSCSFRYFNAAGDAGDALIGESHSPETHLIPIVIQAAMGKRPPMKVFGNDYDTRDGSCIRDYVHVEDLAEAIILAFPISWKNNAPIPLTSEARPDLPYWKLSKPLKNCQD